MKVHPSILMMDRGSRDWICRNAPWLLLVLITDMRVNWRDIQVFLALWCYAVIHRWNELVTSAPIIILRDPAPAQNVPARWRMVDEGDAMRFGIIQEVYNRRHA